jgi:hypothetical protein
MGLYSRIAIVLAAGMTVSSAHAQVQPFGLSVSVEPYEGQDGCQLMLGCKGRTTAESPDVHLVSIHLNPDGGVWYPYDGVRFTMSWPEDWLVEDTWLCGASLVDGDLTNPGSAIELELDECQYPTGEAEASPPVIQLVLDCVTPGRFSVDGGEVRPQLRTCDSEGWRDDFNITGRIEIGDFCGRLPRAACGECDASDHLAGSFLSPPLDVALPLGEVHVDTVRVRGYICGGLPSLCGGVPSDEPCLEGLVASVPWVQVSDLGMKGPDSLFEVTVTTEGLAEGLHETRIVAESVGCTTCFSNCQELRLGVLPPTPVTRTSWSQLKDWLR